MKDLKVVLTVRVPDDVPPGALGNVLLGAIEEHGWNPLALEASAAKRGKPLYVFIPDAKRDWALRVLIPEPLQSADGKGANRIVQMPTESEARDWVIRFPQSYQLVSRDAAGEWRTED